MFQFNNVQLVRLRMGNTKSELQSFQFNNVQLVRYSDKDILPQKRRFNSIMYN